MDTQVPERTSTTHTPHTTTRGDSLMTLKLCVMCGEPSPESRCDLHQLPARPKPSATTRGYNSAWERLSKRARTIQPWCSACGSKDDLTTDHLRWPALSLADVDVLCRSHNSKKGAARTTDSAATTPARVGSNDWYKDPREKDNLLTHSGGHFE